MEIHLSAREGSFSPWWKQIRVEAFGWTSRLKQATSANGKFALEQAGNAWATTIPESSAGADLVFQ